jgi:hypothetical protein
MTWVTVDKLMFRYQCAKEVRSAQGFLTKGPRLRLTYGALGVAAFVILPVVQASEVLGA